MCKMACHLMIRGKMAYKSCCLLLLSLTFCSKISETGCIDMSPFGERLYHRTCVFGLPGLFGPSRVMNPQLLAMIDMTEVLVSALLTKATHR